MGWCGRWCGDWCDSRSNRCSGRCLCWWPYRAFWQKYSCRVYNKCNIGVKMRSSPVRFRLFGLLNFSKWFNVKSNIHYRVFHTADWIVLVKEGNELWRKHKGQSLLT